MTSRARCARPPFVAGVATALLAACLALAGAAHAQAPAAASPGGPSWSALTQAQQSALAPLKKDWSDIDATRKQKWLEIAARLPSLPPEEGQRIQERMTEWARMTPEERGRARVQFQEARKISPQDRQARWDAYMALPSEERRALANSAKTVPKANAAAVRGPEGEPATAPDTRKASPSTRPPPPPATTAAPTVVQARPGASTTLISKTATPPAHVQAGQPKISAGEDVVNRRTMLPQASRQGTAAAASAPQ